MNTPPPLSAINRYMHLLLILGTTLVALFVSIISLLSGWLTIFQNLFYIPIILACIYYTTRGFFFSVLLSCTYFVLILFFSHDPIVLEGALIRVFIFVLVAGVITYTSKDRMHAAEALRESEEKYRLLIEQAEEGVWIVDKEYRTTFINTRLAGMFGYSQQEMIGKYVREFMPTMDQEIHDRRIRERLEGKIDRFEQQFARKDGSIFWAIASVTPIRENGNVVGAFSMLTDITDRRRAEEALKMANKKLNLLGSITRHDILNQLMVVNGYLELLHEKVPDPAIEDYFTRITNASARIGTMIQFTKAYEQIGVHAPVWQDCRTLVDTAAKDAPLGEVIMKNDLTDGTEVFADPLIVKVFYSLMDNAVRHGETITTIHFSGEERGGDYHIACEDDGMGVPADEKGQIFDRGHGKNTGFGLFLAREILGITGINIHETGEQGEGARFEIVVPKGVYRVKGGTVVPGP